MAKRKATRRIPSTEIQGKGSYVVLRGVKYQEVTRVMEMGFKMPDSSADYTPEEKQQMLDAEHRIRELIAENIVEWDWVDDDDQPLTIPRTAVEVGELLYTHEVSWLSDQVMGSVTDQKN